MTPRLVNMLALALGLGAASCVTAPAAPAETFQLAVPRAVAYDGAGVPQFAAGEPFILGMADNPGRRVYASTADMVRASADGAPELWLRCSDLQAPVGQCATPAGQATAATMTRTLPICPGDPRCPRPKKKK